MSSWMHASWKTPTMPVGPSYVDCSSLSRSTRSGSVAVPVTGIGRVCGVSASSAPRVTTSSPPRSSQAASSSAQNWRQRMLGSMPRIRITSRSQARGRGDRDPGGGPGDPPVAVVVGADHRAVDLEVVELLGVDGPDDVGVPHVHEVVDDRGGGVRGVVPALEGRDHHGRHQVRDVLELDHRSSVVRATARAAANRGGGSERAPPPPSRRRSLPTNKVPGPLARTPHAATLGVPAGAGIPRPVGARPPRGPCPAPGRHHRARLPGGARDFGGTAGRCHDLGMVSTQWNAEPRLAIPAERSREPCESRVREPAPPRCHRGARPRPCASGSWSSTARWARPSSGTARTRPATGASGSRTGRATCRATTTC